VIGGGPVGVELAGEIVVDYPDKKVILVHGGSRLIEFLGPKASEKTLAWLRKKNVEVLLNERVDVESISLEGVYKTTNGKAIEADCHFSCIGSKVSSSWMRSSFLKEALDESGRVKVDESLRVEGHANVFAVGDVTAIQVSGHDASFLSFMYLYAP
jgi:NADH dehydrogenase FAD-containing subunit